MNIPSIFFTDSVLKNDTFKEVNDLQLLNIYSIFVAFDVLNSFEIIIEVNFMQSLNILFNCVTWLVSKLIFKSFKLAHPENIYCIFSTDLVLKLDSTKE